MRYIEMQFLVRMGHAMRAQAEIVSGAYKFSRRQQACGRNEDGGFQFRDLTDEEKLLDKIQEMNQHLHLAQDIAEHAASGEPHEEP